MKQNPKAKEAILRAVNDQLESSESPEVRVEYDRLRAMGISDEVAREMIATILAFHIFAMMKSQVEFDYGAYVSELKQLPEIDYGEE